MDLSRWLLAIGFTLGGAFAPRAIAQSEQPASAHDLSRPTTPEEKWKAARRERARNADHDLHVESRPNNARKVAEDMAMSARAAGLSTEPSQPVANPCRALAVPAKALLASPPASSTDIFEGCGKYLSAHSDVSVVVEGSAMDTLGDEYALAIALTYAANAENRLVEAGAAPDQITKSSLGRVQLHDVAIRQGAIVHIARPAVTKEVIENANIEKGLARLAEAGGDGPTGQGASRTWVRALRQLIAEDVIRPGMPVGALLRLLGDTAPTGQSNYSWYFNTQSHVNPLFGATVESGVVTGVYFDSR